MRNISLASYVIHVRERNSRTLEPTDDIGGSDLLDLFDEFLNARKTASNDTENMILLRVRDAKRSDRMIRGVIDTGEYGYSSELVDVNSLKLAYHKKAGEAGMLPFFFHIYLPDNETNGLLVLQRFGNYGIRGVFADQFQEFFGSRCGDFTIRFKPIVHPAQLGTYTKHGVVKRLVFRRSSLPSDICDTYGVEPEEAYVEYAIIAKRDANLNSLQKMLRQLTKKDGGLLIEEPPHFESDQILLEVDLNGHRRTIDVKHTNKLRAYFDITDEVDIGADGHPTFDSMARQSDELVEDIWRELKAPNRAN